jgi:phosphotransferase system HPr (HPr) family protein
MSEQKVTRNVVVTDPSGVHVRTASALLAISRRFRSEITVSSKHHKAKASSMLDMLALAAPRGSTITLEADGPDAEEVLDALEPIFTGDENILVAALKK